MNLCVCTEMCGNVCVSLLSGGATCTGLVFKGGNTSNFF